MREMKDSGIEWIGEIPVDWGVMPNKYLMWKKKEIFPRYNGEDIISLSMNGVVVRDLDAGGKMPTSFDGYQYIENGNLLMCLFDIDVTPRCIGLIKCNGLTSPAYSQFVLTGLANAEYYNYYYTMLDNDKTLVHLAKNLRHSLTEEQLGTINTIVPPLNEQIKIAEYLDQKCTEIDSLISDIQKQIETLEQYKRSVITEAVTKGLNPDAEMKDSGVQWIGEIPEHWKVENPKWHFVQRKDRATKGLTQLTASQKYGVVTQEEYMEITGAKVVTVEKDFDILKLVCPGDFIIHMRSFQGGLEYSEKRGSISSAYVMLIPQKTIFEPRYYKWFFKSPVYIDALSSTTNLIRDGQAMRYANFIQLPILLMPKEEQEQIANYLDEKCAEIDNIIVEKKQQIETIEEYKKSLIFEYVTGKKEVVTSKQAVLIDPVVLAAMAIDELGDDLRGKTKLQKTMYLCEMMLKLPLDNQYFKYQHGPYDESIDCYLTEINSRKWFDINIHSSPMHYETGINYASFKSDNSNIISEYLPQMKKIIFFLRPMRTSETERVATLFAVWNGMIIDGVTEITDERIIYAARNNWTDNKKNPKVSTWQNTLDKMKASGIVPTGFGLHTLPKNDSDYTGGKNE